MVRGLLNGMIGRLLKTFSWGGGCVLKRDVKVKRALFISF